MINYAGLGIIKLQKKIMKMLKQILIILKVLQLVTVERIQRYSTAKMDSVILLINKTR